ncbi:hypothetical protein [Shewanella surugensis]|uniref:Uncharacterized protein n=1 Tax=Shewanella surugensis TaxID=212020 RepID=A0ABT0L5X7_9GAMM|nr:hypothetical protein [Shewanella surugensis]MCL1123088.1 hypothetical protein [Shewanella surugensis]
MKYLLFVLLIMFASLFKAQAKVCELPESLNGITFLFNISTVYSPSNTMAGMLLESTFSDKTYTIEVLDTGEAFTGSYDYQRFLPKFARFNVREGTGANLALYSKTLVCKTNRMGFVIFSLRQGPEQVTAPHDIGTYVIKSVQ